MYKRKITNQLITNKKKLKHISNKIEIANHTKYRQRLKQETETNVQRGQPEKK